MKQSTRTALKLGPKATDADAAAALDKDGHALTLRDLERSDADLVHYLNKEQPATYARLFQAQYGKAPVAKAAAGTKPAAGQQAKVKLAALGANVTMRQLEKENPALLLDLKHSAPGEYARLYAAEYGKAPEGAQFAAPSGALPESQAGTYRPTAPIVMRAVAPESMVAERLRAEGETPCPLPLLGQSGH